MTATCTIVTKEVKNALTIPVKALKFNPAGGTAFAKPEGLPPPPDAAAGGFPEASQKGAKKGTNRPTKPDGDKVWINLNGKLVPHPPAPHRIRQNQRGQPLYAYPGQEEKVVRTEIASGPRPFAMTSCHILMNLRKSKKKRSRTTRDLNFFWH